MVRVLLTIWATAFLGGLITGKSVFAQTVEPEWAAKPVQCGAPYDVFSNIQSQGMKTFFGGVGLSNSVNCFALASSFRSRIAFARGYIALADQIFQ